MRLNFKQPFFLFIQLGDKKLEAVFKYTRKTDITSTASLPVQLDGRWSGVVTENTPDDITIKIQPNRNVNEMVQEIKEKGTTIAATKTDMGNQFKKFAKYSLRNTSASSEISSYKVLDPNTGFMVTAVPRSLQGTLVISDRSVSHFVNLIVRSPDGECLIGPYLGCKVQSSIQVEREISQDVIIHGVEYKVRYSGPDTFIEKFFIAPVSEYTQIEFGQWDIRR